MRLFSRAVAAATVIGLSGALIGSSAYADAATAAQRPAAHRAIASVQLEGRGFGHGHGMSQYGAQGAARKGLTYEQIMAFYYPGTQWGKAGGAISVHITGDTTPGVLVGARSGLKVRNLPAKHVWRLNRPGARRWKLLPVHRGADTRVWVLTKARRWRVERTVHGAAEFTAGGAPIRLFTPHGATSYRGSLRSAGGAHRVTVNVVALDSYLRGVVPREMPASWSAQAVRAQAVAARTYAAYERRHPQSSSYQICDTSSCQVYGGYSSEVSASNKAVTATAGRILTSGGTPAFTQFSASDGGWTSAGSAAYLPAKQDPYDGYPVWSVTIKAAQLEKAFPAIGALQSVTVTKRDGNGAWGGRVVTVRLTGAKTSTTITGDKLRLVIGLRSNWFRVL